jgi:UDP-2-acetamido-2-deoxy-ribo-hexuluronate aminotransferase
LASVKHFILDVNVIVDLWLSENSFVSTSTLLSLGAGGNQRFWIAASQIPTLNYVGHRVFKDAGLTGDDAKTVVNALMQDFLGSISILSNHGFEQAETFLHASDMEDVQIALAARSLGKQPVCIVTEDQTFDALGEVLVMRPADALAWALLEDSSAQSIPFIDLATQQACLRPQLERGIESVLRHGQYIMGHEVELLEKKLAAYTGAKHCITVASGTEALLISLMALGIGAGDEVITTPFTFVATAEVIVLLGAVPVFVDIEPDTCNIDARLIEAKITPKTKAIMPVSLYGQPADMDAMNAIASKYNLPVIEDAAQSFGATYKGRKSCNLSTLGCTSFFPSKPLGCYGDGGAIFTSDDALYQACREIRVHGQSARYVHTRVGVGGRMDTLQCAIVLAKLERFEWEVEQRQRVAQRYYELLTTDGHGLTQIYDEVGSDEQGFTANDNEAKSANNIRVHPCPSVVIRGQTPTPTQS